MSAPAIEALVITLASEVAVVARNQVDIPHHIVTALCALNMLLLFDTDLLDNRYQFNDFVVEPLADRSGARVSFVNSSRADVHVDREALRHLKDVGHFRDFRVQLPRARM
jgi:hypothetical protein